jgi:glycine cleavage system T protein (aminomethyltransferase)
VKRTPLYDEHVRAGARMVDFAGWRMPVQYTSIIDEHRRVRTAAGLFDVSHMGEIELAGAGAEACCARLFANDARRLAPGRAQYSLIVNEHGGIVDDVIVYRLAPERFLVCVNASNGEKDVAWVRRHATGDCRVTDRSDDYALLSVQGPRAAAIVGRIVPAAVDLKRFGAREVLCAGAPALLARTGYTGEDGFELFVQPSAAVATWRLLAETGAADGLVPVGLGARDTLRLEAALPLYGHELDDDTSPYEVGLGWVVKLDRPDMVGFAALKATSTAAARRSLIGLQMLDGIARQGCPVLACGVEIGKVTSGSYCPFVDKALALALVTQVPSDPAVEVEIRGKTKPARVTDIPFYVSAGES